MTKLLTVAAEKNGFFAGFSTRYFETIREKTCHASEFKMHSSTAHLDVLSHHYGKYAVTGEVQPMGAMGGFSGAQFWKVPGVHTDYCLRRWAKEYPTSERLQFIHAVLWHLHQEGFTRVPLPMTTRGHAGFVAESGYFWQLESWMEGKADFAENPSRGKLFSAMTMLAEMHQTLRTFPVEYNRGACTTVAVRRSQLSDWNETRIEAIYDRVCLADCMHEKGMLVAGDMFLDALSDSDSSPILGAFHKENCGETPELQPGSPACETLPVDAKNLHELNALTRKSLRMLKRCLPTVARQLCHCLVYDVPLIPCVRDIHRSHIFFQAEHVTGMIDFGAMQLDNVAVDVSRLLGSLAGNDVQMWVDGLTAYQSVRRLSDEELELVRVLDRAYTILTALRWMEYIYIKNRVMECSPRVLEQMKHLTQRLECF